MSMDIRINLMAICSRSSFCRKRQLAPTTSSLVYPNSSVKLGLMYTNNSLGMDATEKHVERSNRSLLRFFSVASNRDSTSSNVSRLVKLADCWSHFDMSLVIHLEVTDWTVGSLLLGECGKVVTWAELLQSPMVMCLVQVRRS